MKVVGFLFGLKSILFAHQNIKNLSVDLHYRKKLIHEMSVRACRTPILKTTVTLSLSKCFLIKKYQNKF